MINQTELIIAFLHALAPVIALLFGIPSIIAIILLQYEKKLDRDDLIKYPNQISQFNRTPYV